MFRRFAPLLIGLLVGWPAASSGGEDDVRGTIHLFHSQKDLRDLPRYGDFLDFRSDRMPAGAAVKGTDPQFLKEGCRLHSRDEPIEVVVPLRRPIEEDARLALSIRHRGRVVGEVRWLDAEGRPTGKKPIGEFERIGAGRYLKIDMPVARRSPASAAAIGIQFTQVGDLVDLGWIQLIRDLSAWGRPQRLGRRSLLARQVELDDEVGWTVKLPVNGRLLFSTGFKSRRGRKAEGEIEFLVEVRSKRSPAVELFSRRVDIESGKTDPHWEDHLVDLSDYAGREVTLTFRVRAVNELGADQGGVYLWGDPVIATAGAGNHRRVILIVLDAFRRDKVGAYGSPDSLTPFIDEFAAQGALWEDALATASWTLPSFASFYTSLYPSTHGAGRPTPLSPRGSNNIPPPYGLTEDALTLAEILADNGFKTGCYHNNRFLSPEFHMDQGFQSINRSSRGEASLSQALAFLRGNLGEDVFVLLHFMEPHGPYSPPAKFRARFHVDRLPNKVEGRRLKREALYNGEVAHTDELVGAFLEGLDNLGVGKNTLVILTADHGEEFWDHIEMEEAHYTDRVNRLGIGHGHALFTEVISVPLIMRLPGKLEAGTRVERRVSLVDMAPTILDWLDLPIPVHFVGRSLLPGSPHGEPRGYDFAESFTRGGLERRAYWEGRWKLIVEPTSGFLELYDVEADPGEQENLASSHPDKAEELLQKLNHVYEEAQSEREQLTLGDPPLPNLGKKAREELKALGYID
jgi:arylsulfatase A-like enzyme